MAKSTKRQMVEREDDIQAALALGKDHPEFAAELARKHKCSEASIVRQYRAIITSMVEIQKEQRGELKVKLMLRNDLLYKKALESENLRGALDAVNLQAKIGGLYQAEKKEEEKPAAKVFNFVQADNSKPLQVVPDDDESRNK